MNADCWHEIYIVPRGWIRSKDLIAQFMNLRGLNIPESCKFASIGTMESFMLLDLANLCLGL